MFNKTQKKPNAYYPRYNSGQKPQVAQSRKTKRPRVRRFVICIFLLAILVIVGHIMWSRHETAHKRLVAAENAKIEAREMANFGSVTEGVINSNPEITFEVSVTDLNDNDSKEFGNSVPMVAASVNKIITAADFLSEVESHQQSLSETINSYSAEYEIQQMIVVSDDNAWAALNDDLGYSQLQSYGQSLGLTSFNALANTISTSDIASVLAKLYEGQLLNSTYTNLLLSYLKQANYRDFIVPSVPSSDVVYHKIGLLNDNVNDAAIITNGSKAVVLVIFTNGNGVYNWTERAQLMQQIATSAITNFL